MLLALSSVRWIGLIVHTKISLSRSDRPVEEEEDEEALAED